MAALIPTVIDGQQLPPAAAIEHFKTTQQHLGIFSSPEEADAFGIELGAGAGGAGPGGGGLPPMPMLDTGAKAPPYPPRHMLEGPMG